MQVHSSPTYGNNKTWLRTPFYKLAATANFYFVYSLLWWRWMVEREIRTSGVSWGKLRNEEKDRQQWWSMVIALCAQGHEED